MHRVNRFTNLLVLFGSDALQARIGAPLPLTLTILAGDVNNGNSVSSTDFLLLRAHYGKQGG